MTIAIITRTASPRSGRRSGVELNRHTRNRTLEVICPATMLPNRIVARFADGRMVKGTTQDFAPAKDAFHVIGSEGGARPVKVTVADLKAVFFVKSLVGNPAYSEIKEFGAPVPGRKVQVTFKDSETLVGSTQGYQPDRPGFFMIPADPQSNNERVFIVAKAVAKVDFLS